MDKQSYTIRFVLQKCDLDVLKKALDHYPYKKEIVTDLLGIIKYQEGEQNERRHFSC